MALRVIREEFNPDYRSVTIDDPTLADQVRDYVDSVSPGLGERVEYYDAEAEGLPALRAAATSTSRSTRPSTARSGCRRAARSSSSTPRRSRSST